MVDFLKTMAFTPLLERFGHLCIAYMPVCDTDL